jgi:predicted nucleic acid-binding protein
VPVDHGLADAAAALAARLRLRGADATYVAVASRLGVPLVTWDDKQRQRAASLVTIHTAV